jgi:nucleoside-diphosphate-sugar epimerase
MTRFLADALARAHWFDIGAARRDLGYAPAVTTAEGLERLAGWFRTRPGAGSLAAHR